MENTVMSSTPNSSYKNIIIIVLLVLLLFSFLGINIFIILGNIIQNISEYVIPFLNTILSYLGYTSGIVINKTADVIDTTAKTGVDITTGAIKEVGDLLIDASKRTNYRTDNTSPSNSYNPIQKPITSKKNAWCLTGEYQEKRSCVEMNEYDTCVSGQIFPSKQMCLYPQ